MSDRIQHRSGNVGDGESGRGQTLVEFALVLPLLLVLLLGLADFGRVFHAGIAIEAASRNAAEAASQEYLQLVRGKGAANLDSADYDGLHQLAINQACDELGVLPGGRAADSTCLVPIAVCVHDGGTANPGCGGASTAACSGFSSGLNTVLSADANGLAYVEVRACYQFRSLAGNMVLSLPLSAGIDLGNIDLLRIRSFAVADY